ncbi:hypothetical protein [Streptomyces kanamyceticus]|uniref:Uncharacterized protein n=1 Tax=Streptomyces kanamyceticus TaxID=1967 RepID=A0A5J6GHF4_STRKN|nr:hypothetical protein [Streptomyces kanamyceticus]QEU92576.1 hypothetical protein CP970_18185 [Streptomyces kanamyceticus]
MTDNTTAGTGAAAALPPEDRKVIRNARIVLVTPLAFLIVAIIGGVLINSGALPDSLSGVFRVPGQALPLLAVAALSLGVVTLRRQGRWRGDFLLYFAGGGLAQLAPLLLLMHHYPAVLISPLLPGALTLAYGALDRRSRHHADG